MIVQCQLGHLKAASPRAMINRVARVLGIIVGLAAILLAPFLFLDRHSSVLSALSMFLMGIVFTYYGFTNRSVFRGIFRK